LKRQFFRTSEEVGLASQYHPARNTPPRILCIFQRRFDSFLSRSMTLWRHPVKQPQPMIFPNPSGEKRKHSIPNRMLPFDCLFLDVRVYDLFGRSPPCVPTSVDQEHGSSAPRFGYSFTGRRSGQALSPGVFRCEHIRTRNVRSLLATCGKRANPRWLTSFVFAESPRWRGPKPTPSAIPQNSVGPDEEGFGVAGAWDAPPRNIPSTSLRSTSPS